MRRKKGQVVRSIEINAVLNVLISLVILKISGDYIMHNLKELANYFWGNITLFNNKLDENFIMPFIIKLLGRFIMIMLPLLASVFVVGILSNVAQFGFLISFDSLKPSFDKINPGQGF